MKLLKVGHRYINLDLVTDIRVSESKITVYLAVGSPDGVRTLTFQEDDAKTLQEWLDQNAESVQSEAAEFRPATAGTRSTGRGLFQGAAKRQD